MRKVTFPLGILFAASVAMTSCSNNEQNEQAKSADTNTDDVTTLRFSHFMTANDNINTEALKPWSKKSKKTQRAV
ncbi:hypothetical protein [Psychrobacter pacificensis]|uniref:Uncharacterized protein n=1 Tax=Psychrobacter pacificensis TaxID=112002 RepID=A0A1G6WDX7_9GAMM|nr:hypothetical protein [Psychrobacter pacificensis]GLR29064.1 hypothetical protein GCM10007915_13020 [Psychrobacter pacificensis]SDD64052.1 hypothetical protein SAMN05660405_00936 [Psychrobacter pacificensis]